MMRKQLICICGGLMALSGCNSGSAEFRDIPAQTVTVGQSTFDVRQNGSTVELVRTNAEYAPTFAGIIPRAATAVEQATGCIPRPNSWTGEQTIMQVEVDCED